MKKKNLLLTAFVSLGLTSSTLAQVPNYVPTNGLVAAYTFEGNANDLSGNSLNGSVIGATLTNDRFGNNNSAYNFNGSGNYIGVPHSSILNMQQSTWLVWVKITNASGGNGYYFMGKRDNAQHHVSIVEYLGNGGSQIGWASGQAAGVGSGNLVDGNWHMLAITYDQLLGSNNYTFYFDGQIGSTSTIQPFNFLNGELRFGVQDNGSYWQNLNGSIDDAYIYNRILTLCEIQDLFSSQLNTTFVFAGNDQTICDGEQITLTATGSQNYNWNNGVVDGVPFSPTATTDYIVTADSAGCQSSDTLTVFVNQPSSSTLNETALDSYTLNGQTYTQSGTYTQVLPNNDGCDSTITLNLTMNFTGINELNGSYFSVSPNPADDFISVNYHDYQSLSGSSLKIINSLGQLILKIPVNQESSKIDISTLNNGVYFIQMVDIHNNAIGYHKILIH